MELLALAAGPKGPCMLWGVHITQSSPEEGSDALSHEPAHACMHTDRLQLTGDCSSPGGMWEWSSKPQ